jgi:hypothetical protein
VGHDHAGHRPLTRCRHGVHRRHRWNRGMENHIDH